MKEDPVASHGSNNRTLQLTSNTPTGGYVHSLQQKNKNNSLWAAGD